MAGLEARSKDAAKKRDCHKLPGGAPEARSSTNEVRKRAALTEPHAAAEPGTKRGRLGRRVIWSTGRLYGKLKSSDAPRKVLDEKKFVWQKRRLHEGLSMRLQPI